MKIQRGSRQEQVLMLLMNSTTGMSIDEMAIELGISRNAIKQHLVVLEKYHYVQEAALNRTGGRPARAYTITEEGINFFPKLYGWFCNLLLSELAVELGKEKLQKMMWSLGVKVCSSLITQVNSKEPAHKLASLIKLMQSLGYHAKLEQDSPKLSIEVSNCVYHDIAQKHPEICHFDQALISYYLEKKIHKTACIAKNDCACRFNIVAP